MDVTSTAGIATLATNMAGSKLAGEVSVAVLRKALNIEAEAAESLVASIPEQPVSAPPGNWGGQLDVMA